MYRTVFKTDRLHVRQLIREDFAQLHTVCGDAEVMKYVGNLHPYKEQQTRQVILKCLRSYSLHGWGGWGLWSLVDHQFIGYGGFEFVKERSMPELFYILHPSCWGQGLASEFAIAAVNYAFKNFDMERIGASFDPANLASIRVATKAGFAYSHQGFDEFKLPAVYYVISPPS